MSVMWDMWWEKTNQVVLLANWESTYLQRGVTEVGSSVGVSVGLLSKAFGSGRHGGDPFG
jgi:hypothetical protein